MEFNQPKRGLSWRLKKFFKETVRVMRVTKKPNKEEFLTTTKVTGLGCAIIGIVGFAVFLIKQLLF
jgi:protein transport protein SEC61 subunit gamma and related proteins